MGSNAPSRPEPRYLKHIRSLPIGEVFAAGEAVESLVDHPGWELVVGVLRAERSEIDRSLDGRDEPLERAQYALKHGRRSGLSGAEDVVDAIVHHYRVELARQQARHEGAAGAVPGGG